MIVDTLVAKYKEIFGKKYIPVPNRKSAVDPNNVDQAEKDYLVAAKIVMKRMNFDWTHPDKAFIENEYRKCIKAKEAAGASREEISAAR